jgi:hypothetical protein
VAALLPLAFGLLLAARLGSRVEPREPGAARGVLLRSAVGTGVVTLLLTESLSLAGAFAREPLVLGWSVAVAFAALAAVRSGTTGARALARAAAPGAAGWTLAVLAGATGVVALAAPPNTWDALTYHLARVAHWIQNRHVGVYPTASSRQVEMSPFAEFAIAHLVLLWGSDRLANLVQWSAMIGTWLAVSRIAAQLGAGPRGQRLAALFAATSPMGILQGSSAQNDWVAGFWLAAFTSLCLDLARDGFSRPSLLAASGALGLGILTKGTVAVFAPAPLLALALARRRDGLRALAGPALAGLAVVLALQAGHALRSLSLGGSPLGPDARYRSADLGPRLLASSVVRNLSLHAAAPWPAWNRALERSVRGFHHALGVDVDHPDTTYRATRFAVPAIGAGETARWTRDPGAVLRHEDHAGSPLHVLAIVAAGALALGRPPLRRERALQAQLWTCAVAFLLFCALLRWQPWHARLHLPLLALCGAWVGRVAERTASPRVASGLAAAFACASLPWLLAGLPRPLVGPGSVLRVPRSEQYLASRPHLAPAYLAAARYLRATGCRSLGLALAGDSGEYPLWVLLRDASAPPRIEHLTTERGSLGALETEFRPCAIVSMDPPREELRFGSNRYTATWRSDELIVLEPGESRP